MAAFVPIEWPSPTLRVMGNSPEFDHRSAGFSLIGKSCAGYHFTVQHKEARMSVATIHDLLHQLWRDFTRINPQADAIQGLLESRGETVINDHIAFRTFDEPAVNIDVLAQPFTAVGFVSSGNYNFEKKKLRARHYEHPDPDLPKVFISELKLAEFGPEVTGPVRSLLAQIPGDMLRDPELCAAGRPWQVSHADYQALADVSEYAGWMAAFGFRANHFTVLVNRLLTVHSLTELNELVKQAGFPLNQEGGEIKGSPSELLEQSSTLASQVEVEFVDGKFVVPGCYYEFARRHARPDGRMFNGFVPNSADKIFQSTDRR